MGIIELQKAALESLADWSKWLVALETALVGGVVWLSQESAPATVWGKILFSCASCSFVFSAFFALWLVGAVLSAIQKLPFEYTVHQYKMWGKFKLIHVAFLQHLLLVVGVLALLTIGVLRVWGFAYI